ncbi:MULTISPECIES: dihydroorotase [Hydrocarboniphaga]|uniref:Dihydroorotase n=1 Tax=Hydrocarboniphaga effusa AP103 TaxID=1172194 RepID=I7ZF69_9GAMM|nr:MULTISPECIES: dihydroorotase [Hydrocarboniphaga]EIT70357.1 dihydroorotase [Hydrocarboniphaga effusa AP103]MDZ4077888.1 dihydroorotase [Hydrocarboniphaga sp.]
MLITNARIVNEGREFEGDVLIRNGRIEKIASSITNTNETVVDAKGKLLIPGMIDDQVHFREPGLTHKGDISTETSAALAGGITSVMEMPNTNPTTTTRERLADKYTLATGKARTNFAFYFGAANDNADEIARVVPGEACAIKIFMGASTGNMLVDDPKVLDDIFARAQIPIVTHCEDTPTIKINEEAARQKWGDAVPMSQHPYIRSEEACYKSTELAVGLARRHGTSLHVLHLTTARELEFFTPGPVKGKQITVEACVHHLFYDESSYESLGSLIKCNPAIKTAADRKALVAAVMADRIDVIATDHAPHTAEEKANPSYFKAPSGLPLVQHALPMLFELVRRGELDLHTLVRKTSHAVADRFGVVERGYLREGYWADLTLVDTDAPTTVRKQDLYYKCGWSPLEGQTLPVRIDTTWVNGEIAFQNGQVLPQVLGKRLAFAR